MSKILEENIGGSWVIYKLEENISCPYSWQKISIKNTERTNTNQEEKYKREKGRRQEFYTKGNIQ